MVLTNENYYSPEANQAFMSVSQFKSFEVCEAAAMAELRGEFIRPKTTALLVGSYVDSWFEGTLDAFKAANSEIFKRDGTLKADYAQAEKIIERVQRDTLFMEYMSGEKQVVRTGEIDGAPFKIKMDSYHPGKMIVDLKTSRSLQRIMGQSLVEHFGYDIQGAVYQEIEGNHLPFYLAIVTKEDPPDMEIVEIEAPDLQNSLDYVRRNLPHIIAVKSGQVAPSRCGVCPYCRSTKVLKEPIPASDLGFSYYELAAMRGEYV